MDIKIPASLLFTLLLSFFLQATFGQHIETIAVEAEKYARALEKGNWEKVMDQTYPEIIRLNGGREAMLSQAKAFELDMEQRDFELRKAELAAPQEILESGRFLMSIVPMRLVFEGPLGTLYSQSGLLAVSDDNGENWSFIDLAQVQIAQLSEIFPEINPALDIPAKRIYQE